MQGPSGWNRPGNRASAWSKDEVDLLIQLDRRFHEERYPNVRIREFLPQKTLKQISDKRTEVVADEDSSSGSSVYVSAAEEADDAPRRSIGRERWQATLQNAILARSLEQEHPLKLIERQIEDMARKHNGET